MVAIWYEAHAQTHDNAGGVASGHRDVGLTDLGREQARGPKRARYRGEHFDVVLTSDTQRAYDTARLMFEGRGIPIVQDARLRECDYGDLEGEAASGDQGGPPQRRDNTISERGELRRRMGRWFSSMALTGELPGREKEAKVQ